MKVIIMGCGLIGQQVAVLLAGEGHQVSVIDQDARALERLEPNVNIAKVKGVGFDRDVLIRAGIEQADAFAATSSSDNANIIAARIARNIFHVPRVVARLYDPRRAEIYRRLGLITISLTTWGAEKIRELIRFAEMEPVQTYGSGEVLVTRIDATPRLIGRMVRDLTVPGEINVTAIVRDNHAFIPVTGTEFLVGDAIYLIVVSDSLDRLSQLTGTGQGD